ncbi:hypothetical protein EMPG_13502 [Blastomyces silverae]|uniref:Uncharacterized protein n=1 Tax=Blastomyces silverae TaxID=2060906 RepID=A0A0H1BJH3_9EURO|nr:hypothetical protein EMPG_13502 [Blastomyces silverae]
MPEITPGLGTLNRERGRSCKTQASRQKSTRWAPRKLLSKPPKHFSLLNTCEIGTGITWPSVSSALGETTSDTELNVLSESKDFGDGSLADWNISNCETRDTKSLVEGKKGADTVSLAREDSLVIILELATPEAPEK